MKLRGVVYIIAALIVGALVIANWTLFTAPVDLNFLVAQVQAPLIVPVILIAGVILLLDAAVHLFSRHAWIRERRAMVRDLDVLRQRAEHEEESRIGALRVTLDRELGTIRSKLDQLLASESELRTRLANEPLGETGTESRRYFEPELIPPQASDARGRSR